MLLTASYKPDRPFVVVVAVSRWHVFLSDMYFPEHPKEICVAEAGIRRLLCFRTVRHSLRPNGARYGGTDGIEQTPLIVRTVSSQYNWRYPGFHRFLAVGSRARNPPLVPRLLTDSVFGEQNALTFLARTRRPANRANTNPVPAEVGRLFALQTGLPMTMMPAFPFWLQIEGQQFPAGWADWWRCRCSSNMKENVCME